MVSADKIKTSLIGEVGVSEDAADRMASYVMTALKEYDNYDEFYYRVFPNNRIYFFIKKKTGENSYEPITLNKGGFNIYDETARAR